MSTPIEGNQVRGHLETMILSILESEAAHGFEVVKRLCAAGNGALELKEGTVYPVLYRLEDAGLIRSKWEKETTGRRGPRRKIYQLTKRGERQLNAGRAQWKSFVETIGPIVGGVA
ncbi:helix-turn-helix transcriptional regulator [Thalassoglobus sp. JC818]|uniref:PadR family transcriptional regulator n=1 Tax=Thalassoglobus sp. JC818 TaxID=3232136 RepID=UPI0034599EDD